MKIAHIKATGAELTSENQVIKLAGEPVAYEKIVEYDRLGVLEWVSSDVRLWALGDQSPDTSEQKPSPETDTSRSGTAYKFGRAIAKARGRSPKMFYGAIAISALVIVGLLVAVLVLSHGAGQSADIVGSWTSFTADGGGMMFGFSDDGTFAGTTLSDMKTLTGTWAINSSSKELVLRASPGFTYVEENSSESVWQYEFIGDQLKLTNRSDGKYMLLSRTDDVLNKSGSNSGW